MMQRSQFEPNSLPPGRAPHRSAPSAMTRFTREPIQSRGPSRFGICKLFGNWTTGFQVGMPAGCAEAASESRDLDPSRAVATGISQLSDPEWHTSARNDHKEAFH